MITSDQQSYSIRQNFLGVTNTIFNKDKNYKNIKYLLNEQTCSAEKITLKRASNADPLIYILRKYLSDEALIITDVPHGK